MDRDNLRNKIFWLCTLLHSTMATCDRLRTASSTEKNKRLVGFGYNGSLPGNPHCDEVGHLIIENHCERTTHGERNLVLNTRPEDLRGATVRVIGTPCIPCLRDNLIATGVEKALYAGEYSNARGKEFINDFKDKNTDITIELQNVDWTKILQEVLDLLAQKGGAFYNQGFKLKITKEKL